MVSFPVSPVAVEKRGVRGQESAKVKEQIKNVEKEIAALRDGNKFEDEIKGVDFGANDHFYSFWNRCFELNQQQYNYKICPFENVIYFNY